MRSDLAFYIEKKVIRHIGRMFLRLFVMFFFSIILSFSLIFIFSMRSGLEKLIVSLGSGNVLTSAHVQDGMIISSEEVKRGSGMIFSRSGSYPVTLKGISFDSYFSEERRSLLSLDDSAIAGDRGIVLSDSIAESLDVSSGDNVTLMVWDEGENRARPVLMRILSTYSSGYSSLDSTLAFVSMDVLSSPSWWENKCDDINELGKQLENEGIRYYTSEELYPVLYENMDMSVRMLLFVFALVSVLSSFHVSSFAVSLIDEDRKSIANLLLLGMGKKRVFALYLIISCTFLLLSLLLGFFAGTFLSFLIPEFLSLLSSAGFDAMGMYLTKFDIVLPVLPLCILYFVLLLASFLVLAYSMRNVFVLDESMILREEE